MLTYTTEASGEREETSLKWAKLLSVHDSFMHELSQEVITIGSSEECMIVIKHEEVSSPHCLLMKDPDDVIWLYDCSKTGTRCNDGKWLQQDCVTLHTGDYFYLLWDEVDVTKRVGFCVLFVDDFKLLASSGESDKIKTTELPLQPSSSQFMKPSTSNDDTDLENCLTCVICGDIYFECCSVQPCLHSFCTLCWLRCKRYECPMCRKSVSAYAKNHQLNNLVDVFLRKHPEKLKSESEQNEIKQEIARLTRLPNHTRRYNNRTRRNRERITLTGGDYGLLSSSSGVFPVVPTITTTATTRSVSSGPIIMPTSLPMSAGCVICSWLPPSYDRRGNSMTSISGITLGDHGPRIEECSAHCYCTCCNRPMPSRTTTIPQLHSINRTECEVCRRTFCSLINPYGCSTCDGYCLSRVQDLTRYNSIPRNLLLNNRIETRILDDYLTSQGISIPTFINHCLTFYINTTSIYSSCILDRNSLICKNCSERLLSQLAYQYRLSICPNELPTDVIIKPNCYYGQYCRYQSYNYNHARRFNHICERSI
ncbi:E3 ubiquitin-protein ligase CHFR [Schistosoma bovis]|uniref:RING-type E3 ubiquitin transferase n=1 Tax=Schistosoma bovis TaxID=6184 RepID=A0A430Q0Z8_SCHBO|nr:E3 ubiquitin-protein ligase CHFR [Schistosoma bovis]